MYVKVPVCMLRRLYMYVKVPERVWIVKGPGSLIYKCL